MWQQSKLALSDREIAEYLRKLDRVIESYRAIKSSPNMWTDVTGRTLDEVKSHKLDESIYDAKRMYEQHLRSRYLQRFPQTPWYISRDGSIRFESEDDTVHYCMTMKL
ncbi:hypothetical protein C8J25_101851 [Sphingomonas faeni]|uniref:Uncharacterized protein n=2 Tax=Sphingomonas faeni TaxID=185950 RepID=A0A2T5UCX3_9SPHN|nr:hypothetical protein C8J25_101851 [Sphingomonas faeni]